MLTRSFNIVINKVIFLNQKIYIHIFLKFTLSRNMVKAMLLNFVHFNYTSV